MDQDRDWDHRGRRGGGRWNDDDAADVAAATVAAAAAAVAAAGGSDGAERRDDYGGEREENEQVAGGGVSRGNEDESAEEGGGMAEEDEQCVVVISAREAPWAAGSRDIDHCEEEEKDNVRNADSGASVSSPPLTMAAAAEEREESAASETDSETASATLKTASAASETASSTVPDSSLVNREGVVVAPTVQPETKKNGDDDFRNHPHKPASLALEHYFSAFGSSTTLMSTPSLGSRPLSPTRSMSRSPLMSGWKGGDDGAAALEEYCPTLEDDVSGMAEVGSTDDAGQAADDHHSPRIGIVDTDDASESRDGDGEEEGQAVVVAAVVDVVAEQKTAGGAEEEKIAALGESSSRDSCLAMESKNDGDDGCIIRMVMEAPPMAAGDGEDAGAEEDDAYADADDANDDAGADEDEEEKEEVVEGRRSLPMSSSSITSQDESGDNSLSLAAVTSASEDGQALPSERLWKEEGSQQPMVMAATAVEVRSEDDERKNAAFNSGKKEIPSPLQERTEEEKAAIGTKLAEEPSTGEDGNNDVDIIVNWWKTEGEGEEKETTKLGKKEGVCEQMQQQQQEVTPGLRKFPGFVAKVVKTPLRTWKRNKEERPVLKGMETGEDESRTAAGAQIGTVTIMASLSTTVNKEGRRRSDDDDDDGSDSVSDGLDSPPTLPAGIVRTQSGALDLNSILPRRNSSHHRGGGEGFAPSRARPQIITSDRVSRILIRGRRRRVGKRRGGEFIPDGAQGEDAVPCGHFRRSPSLAVAAAAGIVIRRRSRSRRRRACGGDGLL